MGNTLKNTGTFTKLTTGANPAALLVFIGACFLLRLTLISQLPLLGAEAYYWEWSRHLAAGYFDHPPMIAWLIRLCTEIGTDSPLFIRLGPFLLSILTTITAYLLIRDIFGRQTALASCAVLQILPFFTAAGIIAVPDAPLSFCWLATVYCLYRATGKARPRWWYAAGICLGLGLLSKYHAFLLIPCIGIYLLSTPKLRPWLTRKEPWLALFIALLVFSPNLIWNAKAGLTTFRFLLAERHGSIELEPEGLAEFIGGYLVLLSPMFAVLVATMLPRLLRTARQQAHAGYLLLLSTSLPVIIFFGLISPLVSVGAHWPAVGYMPLSIAALGLLINTHTETGPAIAKPFPQISILFSLVLILAVCCVPIIVRMAPPQLTVAGLTIPLGDTRLKKELHGWQALGRRIEAAVDSMPHPARTFIITHSYRMGSQIRFLTESQYPTHTSGYKSPHQYGIWERGRHLSGWDAVFVDKEKRHIDVLERQFERIGPVEHLTVTDAGMTIRTFCIVRCYGYIKH